MTPHVHVNILTRDAARQAALAPRFQAALPAVRWPLMTIMASRPGSFEIQLQFPELR
jgi:hypothetical protein